MSMKRLFFGSAAALMCIVGISASALAAESASPLQNIVVEHASADPFPGSPAMVADPFEAHMTVVALNTEDPFPGAPALSNEVGITLQHVAITDPLFGKKPVGTSLIHPLWDYPNKPDKPTQKIASTWPEWSPPKLSLEGDGGKKKPLSPSILAFNGDGRTAGLPMGSPDGAGPIIQPVDTTL